MTLIILFAVAAFWALGSLFVFSLCVAARRGDRQQVIDGGIVAARSAAERQLAQALTSR